MDRLQSRLRCVCRRVAGVCSVVWAATPDILNVEGSHAVLGGEAVPWPCVWRLTGSPAPLNDFGLHVFRTCTLCQSFDARVSANACCDAWPRQLASADAHVCTGRCWIGTYDLGSSRWRVTHGHRCPAGTGRLSQCMIASGLKCVR